MNRTAFSILAALALPWLTALGADIDGKWIRQQPGGAVAEILVLKASGSNLTGTIDLGRGGPVDISDGTINGSNLTFKVFRQPGDTGQIYSGTISANELRLTVRSNFLVTGGKGGPAAPPPPPPPPPSGTAKRAPQEQIWTRSK